MLVAGFICLRFKPRYDSISLVNPEILWPKPVKSPEKTHSSAAAFLTVSVRRNSTRQGRDAGTQTSRRRPTSFRNSARKSPSSSRLAECEPSKRREFSKPSKTPQQNSPKRGYLFGTNILDFFLYKSLIWYRLTKKHHMKKYLIIFTCIGLIIVAISLFVSLSKWIIVIAAVCLVIGFFRRYFKTKEKTNNEL